MTKDEAMKLALEALENWLEFDPENFGEVDNKAITALREALAQQALDKMAENARELGLDYEPAQQEPVALKWQQSPIRTAWGDDMVVASVAIDNDHTLSLYCERDQTPKVDAMFAQRTWVGLTDEEANKIYKDGSTFGEMMRMVEAKLKEKNT